jgi:peptidoglycan biosynthesis protein MviN/MurJ (putative lipid II flippase)
VKFVPLLLIAIFLGFMGGHHYYVGRYKMGAFYPVFFAVGIVNAILATMLDATPKGEVYQIFTLLVLIWGLVIMLWIIDLAKICVNKFKIPVSRN